MVEARVFKFCIRIGHIKSVELNGRLPTFAGLGLRDPFQIFGPQSYLWNGWS